MKKYSLLLLFFGCSTTNKVPNYKVSNGYVAAYRYTKPGDTVKDVLSNSDTLIVIHDSMYFKKAVK